MISSTMPSAKYSCSGSPLIFWNGITASDGLSGSGGAPLAECRGTRRDPRHRRGKAVAAPGNGLDAAPLCSPFVKNPAKCGDLHVQIAVFDGRPRPDRGDELGPRDELARPLDQHAENPERARTHCQRSENAALVPSEQDTAPPVEAEPSEQTDIGRGRCVARRRSLRVVQFPNILAYFRLFKRRLIARCRSNEP